MLNLAEKYKTVSGGEKFVLFPHKPPRALCKEKNFDNSESYAFAANWSSNFERKAENIWKKRVLKQNWLSEQDKMLGTSRSLALEEKLP